MAKQGNNWVIIVVVAALLAFGVFVWPTQYRYDTVTRTLGSGYSWQEVYRTNRFTDEAELVFSGHPAFAPKRWPASPSPQDPR